MKNVTTLSQAVKYAIAFGALSTTALSSQAVADQGESVERIEVTGSRIKRADMETASPVTVIDAKAIGAIGATSIDQVLQRMTATGGAMTNPGINNGSGGNARVDLRGLGAQRTLVLVNGRRMINSGTGAASTVDLNTIPVSMIQRIEVLKDGASAVYGSDAISGVVNVILKRDFEGLEMNAQHGRSGENDAEESNFDLTIGGSFEKGNVVFGLSYMDRGEASQGDRAFSNCPLWEDGDGSAPYCSGSSFAAGGVVIANDADGNRKMLTGGNGQGTAPGEGNKYHDFDGAKDAFNYSKDSFLFTPQKRLNLSAIGTYNLSDTTTFFTEATYAKRWSEQQMAPQPVWFSFTYDAEAMGGLLDEHNIADGTEIAYRRRMTDSGPRQYSQVVDTVRAVAGFEGELDNGWFWDTSLTFGRNDSVSRTANLHNMGSLTEAIDEGTFNPLDQASWLPENVGDYIYTQQNTGGSDLLLLAATLSGELFELPAGSVAFAGGLEYRDESAWFVPDSLASQGLANDPAFEGTDGGFDVTEAYVEFAIPVLNDAFLADQVEVTAAARYFDYSTFGDDSTWKLGLTWKISDELMVRGVRSTAFRAPTVSELFGGRSTSFDQISHPATTDTQAEVTVGGNELLTPEQAKTFTAGFVYSPEWFEGFSMTLDYFDIDIENAITSVSSQMIVDLCLDRNGNAQNLDNAICQSAEIEMDLSGRIRFNNGLQNVGNESTRGYDLNLAYTFEAAGINWSANLDTTHLKEYNLDGVEYQGVITNGIGSYAEWKSNFSLAANGDVWSATYNARYIDGLASEACIGREDECFAPTVGTVIYHDLSGSYFVNENVTVSGGINNLFDKQAPYYSGNNDSNTDPFTYDVLGRYAFVKATLTF